MRKAAEGTAARQPAPVHGEGWGFCAVCIEMSLRTLSISWEVLQVLHRPPPFPCPHNRQAMDLLRPKDSFAQWREAGERGLKKNGRKQKRKHTHKRIKKLNMIKIASIASPLKSSFFTRFLTPPARPTAVRQTARSGFGGRGRTFQKREDKSVRRTRKQVSEC